MVGEGERGYGGRDGDCTAGECTKILVSLPSLRPNVHNVPLFFKFDKQLSDCSQFGNVYKKQCTELPLL